MAAEAGTPQILEAPTAMNGGAAAILLVLVVPEDQAAGNNKPS